MRLFFILSIVFGLIIVISTKISFFRLYKNFRREIWHRKIIWKIEKDLSNADGKKKSQF